MKINIAKYWRQALRRSSTVRYLVRAFDRFRTFPIRLASTVYFASVGLVCSLLAGCSTESLNPTRTSPGSADAPEHSSSQSSPNPDPPSRAGRRIKFESFDVKYRGTTQILADEKVVHQRQPYE
ncbi:hypothetical protein [Schlesneria paludicola]|uniref:hypothetical protein n=1 Tax=Schlesneria paludicola TaxID=360056 RepID=UPI00029AE09A|nr:hypothetical protein [Schlesneria paludicola]